MNALSSLYAPLALAAALAPVRDDPPEWRDSRPSVPRKEWDALEGEPAPPLDSLTSWKNCEALGWEDLRGNVVLLDLWGVWCPPCRKEVPHLVELFEKHADDGLIVLGVHSQYRFEEDRLEDFLDEHGVGYAVAVDAENALKEALAVRMWPAYYLVDRDGNVRIAGVDKGEDAEGVKHLDRALEAVLAEPWEGERKTVALTPREKKVAAPPPARAVPGGRAAPSERKPKKSAERKPAKLELDGEGWPVARKKKLYAKNDLRGKAAPGLAVETWLTPEPELEGKVLLIDFWATWCGPCKAAMPHLQELQDAFPEDLVVIGVSDQGPEVVNGRTGKPWGDEVERYLRTMPYTYAQAIDGQARAKTALGVQGIPHVLLVDSRGIVRWQGFPGDAADPLTTELVEAIVKKDRAQREEGEPEDDGGDDGGDGEGCGGPVPGVRRE